VHFLVSCGPVCLLLGLVGFLCFRRGCFCLFVSWCSLLVLLMHLFVHLVIWVANKFCHYQKKKNYYITDDRGEQTWVTRPRPALTDMHIDKTVGFNRWSGWKMKKVGLSWIPMVGWGSVKHHPWEPTTGRLKAR
jgi:hypothetical protein